MGLIELVRASVLSGAAIAIARTFLLVEAQNTYAGDKIKGNLII